MTIITIQERPGAPGPNGSNATVSFDHGSQYSITISDPFTDGEEGLLEWYFEQHLRHPFTDQVRAQTAARSIFTYGEKLFGQVFADSDAYSAYKECLQAGLNTTQIEIAGSPHFHRWHWEALKDPELPRPLVLQATMVRKNLEEPPLNASVSSSPTINMLVVTARPAGKRDMGYRTISAPLVKALDQANLTVRIDLLRPGTYEALDHHLQETTRKYGVGYYHVIHFDVHGSLLTYEQFLKGEEPDHHYLCQFQVKDRFGCNDIPPYQGVKAFLLLEGVKEDQGDMVEATELADLLIAHQVPIAILNACQSGKQVGSSETSLGSRLMQEGVQTVLAMGYSVTVSAAELLMRTLYQQLFDHSDLSSAICAARQELYNSKKRRDYFNQRIDLEDWLLPVVYQNQPQRLTVRPFTTEESQAFHGQDAKRYSSPQPNYGFVGRDLDILQIEKRLLTKRNLLPIRGMGGAGKTTLLQHLGNWWQTTGFVEQVFYFGYDEHAWTREQVITTIAQQILSPVEYLTQFQPLGLDAKQSMLTRLLRAKRHLLMLDNLESITGTHLAIQHTLPKEEQKALHSLLVALFGGKTLVLLGSRSSEAWLAPQTFADNAYDLPGLDEEAASTLTDRILEHHNVTKYRKDADLQRLIKLLDGFPWPWKSC